MSTDPTSTEPHDCGAEASAASAETGDGRQAADLVRFTVGKSALQTSGWDAVRALSWGDLCELLTTHRVGEKNGTCIVPAIFRGTNRKMAEAERIEIVMLDSDAGATLDEIVTAIEARGWAAVVSSTHSHLTTRTQSKRGAYEAWLARNYPDGPGEDAATKFLTDEKGMLPRVAAGATVSDQDDVHVFFQHAPCPKFRITLRLERPWVAGSYESQKQANNEWGECIKALAAALDLRHDESCSDTSRLFYMPRRPADGAAAQTRIIDGSACDIFALPKVRPPEPEPKKPCKAAGSRGRAEAGGAGQAGADFGSSRDGIAFTNPATGEVFSLTRWAARAGRHFRIVDALKARNPEVFVGRVADNVRHHIFCPNEAAHSQATPDAATFVCNPADSSSGGFVIHCRHAHCKGRDRLHFLLQMLGQHSLTIEDLQNPEFQQASHDRDVPWADQDLTEHKVAEHFAQRSEQHLRYCHTRGAWFMWAGSHWKQNGTKLPFHWIRRMTARLNVNAAAKVGVATGKAAFSAAVERFAQADPTLALTNADWNQHPWLLATPDGTVNLRTGSLADAERHHLLSHVTAVGPTATADCPAWLAFLHQATAGDIEVIAFIQRWLGYCLTGITREHALLFVYGPGGNGKGVMLNTVSAILKDYAVTAALDTFTAAQGERHSTEIAMLAGARLVMTTETEEGRAWAEARIKALTGGDPITARFMRQDNFTFLPDFKLTISGNHKPALRNVDDAARRRFLVLPFIYKPEKPNLHLVDELRAEWPGILRWMIEGCLAWQSQGLRPPKAVLAATAEYFAEQDLFPQWLDECCEVGKEFGATTTSLYGSWQTFLHERGEPPRTSKSFSVLLERANFARAKDCASFRGRGYLGLRPRPINFQRPFSECEGDG